MAAGESARIQEAQQLAKTDPRKAEAIYKDITAKAPGATSDTATREYETALISLGELYRDEKSAPSKLPGVMEIILTDAMIGTHKSWSTSSRRVDQCSHPLQRPNHPSWVCFQPPHGLRRLRL